MSRRTFRLAPVLRVRRAQEESARGELLRANIRMRGAEAVEEQAALRYRTVPVSSGPVVVPVFRREQAVAELAAGTLDLACRQVAHARETVLSSHRSWSTAARRVEALERLARRRLDEAVAEEARLDALSVDDLVTSRWIAAATLAGEGRARTVGGRAR